MAAGWLNLGEQPVVSTPWFQLNQAQVRLPDGRLIDHYLLRRPPVVMAAVLDEQDRALMLWRHRFIPDSRGWELPSGIVDPAEDLAAAAAREALAESGWEPVRPRPLLRLEPTAGLTDDVSHVFWTDQVIHRGEPVAGFEAERIEWIPLSDVPGLLANGQIRSATTAVALLFLLHQGRPLDA